MACQSHRGCAFACPKLHISSSSELSPRPTSSASARQISTSTCSGFTDVSTSLLLDFGGFDSNVVREGPRFFKAKSKQNGCKEERVTRMRLGNLSTSRPLESPKSLPLKEAQRLCNIF